MDDEAGAKKLIAALEYDMAKMLIANLESELADFIAHGPATELAVLERERQIAALKEFWLK